MSNEEVVNTLMNIFGYNYKEVEDWIGHIIRGNGILTTNNNTNTVEGTG